MFSSSSAISAVVLYTWARLVALPKSVQAQSPEQLINCQKARSAIGNQDAKVFHSLCLRLSGLLMQQNTKQQHQLCTDAATPAFFFCKRQGHML